MTIRTDGRAFLLVLGSVNKISFAVVPSRQVLNLYLLALGKAIDYLITKIVQNTIVRTKMEMERNKK
jgi:hypothetical protein